MLEKDFVNYAKYMGKEVAFSLLETIIQLFPFEDLSESPYKPEETKKELQNIEKRALIFLEKMSKKNRILYLDGRLKGITDLIKNIQDIQKNLK